LTARDVTKRYGKAAALDHVSFEARPGEAVALWGPNGAGKTTILRCLLGLARYEGDIRIGGLDPSRQGRDARRHIGFVPQELATPAMSVAEMIAFIARLKAAPLGEAHDWLRRLGIAEHADKQIAALSGGMRQRLAVGLAQIGSPAVLLLDEPTANLDAAGRAELLELLRDLKQAGITLIFASHRIDDVLLLADHVLLLERGVSAGMVTTREFEQRVEAQARLTIVLVNGHLPEALTTLRTLGYEAHGSGHTVMTTLPARDKARALSALARAGVEIQDFEWERSAWTAQQS
jgi:ABC-type multidrug transport system ATPase subunit